MSREPHLQEKEEQQEKGSDSGIHLGGAANGSGGRSF